MKEDTKDIILIAGLGISAIWLYSKRDELELPEFLSGGIPSLDLSGIFEGFQMPSMAFPSITFPSFSLGDIFPQVPAFDLAALIPGLGGGLLGGGLPEIPKINIPSITDLLGIGKGEGEEDVQITPQPSEGTWSDVFKGFITRHPYITAAVAVPAVGAASYGIIKTIPYIAPTIGGAGRAIVSGASKVSSNIYNVVKFPKGMTIWKPTKILATKAVATKVGLGAGVITTLFFGGLAGATELTRLIGGTPEMYAEQKGILGAINRAILWLSPAEAIRGFVSPTKAVAMPEIFIPKIIMPTELIVPGGYTEAPIKLPKPPQWTVSGSYTEAPVAPVTRVVPAEYEEAPIAPASSPWIVPAGYREA